MTWRPSLTCLRCGEWPLEMLMSMRRSKLSQTALGAPISFSVIHDRELTQRNPISFELVCALPSTTVDRAKLPSRLRWYRERGAARRFLELPPMPQYWVPWSHDGSDVLFCSLSLDSEVQGRMAMDQKEWWMDSNSTTSLVRNQLVFGSISTM